VFRNWRTTGDEISFAKTVTLPGDVLMWTGDLAIGITFLESLLGDGTLQYFGDYNSPQNPFVTGANVKLEPLSGAGFTMNSDVTFQGDFSIGGGSFNGAGFTVTAQGNITINQPAPTLLYDEEEFKIRPELVISGL